MLIHTQILLVLLLYSTSSHAEKLESSADEVLTRVLGEIRSKIIDRDNISNSSETFVANFVVEPEFHKPKLEFVPHFEHNVFEFMIPSGFNQEDSLVAIIQFYGLASPNLPKFEIIDDKQRWFSIGKINHTVGETYSTDLIQIMLNSHANVSTKYARPNNIYSIEIRATQGAYNTRANLQVGILPLADEIVESEDAVLSRLEETELIDSDKEIANVTENDEDKVVLDWTNKTTQYSVIDFPEIKMELRGSPENVISVSEGLNKGEIVPDFGVYVYTDVPFDEVIELSIEPVNVFGLKPSFLLPAEQSQLVVLNAKLLDFDDSPTSLEFTIRAKFLKDQKNKIATQKLTVEKRNEPDHPPQFKQSAYIFHISELAENNTAIGNIIAVDPDAPDNDASIQYTLLGHKSQNFRITNGSLILTCSDDSDCLDYEETREYNLLAIAVDQFGLSSDPVSVKIEVDDANDNGPTLEMFDKDIVIEDSEIMSPFLFAVKDLDGLKNQQHILELSNNGSEFLSLEQISSNIYQIQLLHTASVGSYILDIIVRDEQGNNPSQKTRVKVNVLGYVRRVLFRRQHYERTINAKNMQTGSSVIQLELDSNESDNIRFILLDGNPGWLTIEEYGGNIYMNELTSGIRSGKFNLKIAAINRDSQRIVATTELTLIVINDDKKDVKVFDKPLTTLFVDRDQTKDDVKIEVTKNSEISLKLVEIEAWDDEMLSIEIDDNDVLIDKNYVIIGKTLIKRANSINLKIGSDKTSTFGLFQIFSTRDPQKVKEMEELMAVPKFGVPWKNQDTIISLKMQEELPVGHLLICLPALNQFDNSIITDVKLSGDGSDHFQLDPKSGCIYTQTHIDYEQMSKKAFDLQLRARLSKREAKARILIEIIDMDDNAPEIRLLNPKKMPLEITENSHNSTNLADIMIFDRDHVGSKQFRYKLTGHHAENFELRRHNQNESILVLSTIPEAQLDREEIEEIALKLIVTDQSENFNELPLRIKILDQNDNSPIFNKINMEVDIFDNWLPQIELAVFNAVDIDTTNNSKISYSLDQDVGKYFEINPISGIVRIISSLSGLARPDPYNINVLAIDNGNPPRSAMTQLQIRIHEASSHFDAQEIRIINPPVGFYLNLTENLPSGSLIYKVKAEVGLLGESIEVDFLYYSIEPIESSDEGWLTVDESTGEVRLLRQLDYEEQAYITLIWSVCKFANRIRVGCARVPHVTTYN